MNRVSTGISKIQLQFVTLAGSMFCGGVPPCGTAAETNPVINGSGQKIAPFFAAYCTRCHGSERQKGNLNLEEFAAGFSDGGQRETWRMIAEQLQFGDMPPEEARQPPASERNRARAWIRQNLLDGQRPGAIDDPRMLLPGFGNHVDHEALFHSPAGPVVPAPPGLWRLRPDIYRSLATRLAGPMEEISQPFAQRNSRSFRDYAALSFVDEPSTDLLLRNAEALVTNQAATERFPAIAEALCPDRIPSEEVMSGAIRLEFCLAACREPTAAELSAFVAFWKRNLATSGHPIGSRATLVAILMLPEVLFRFELGAGKTDALGRRRLSQKENARAVNFALRDQIDDEIFAAAEKGELATRAQVRRQVMRLLNESQVENPQLLRFFREYFGYPNATSVFKDRPPVGAHRPDILVNDLDALILHILEADRDVLRELLTTDRAFVNWPGSTGSLPEKLPVFPAVGFETVYGLPLDWKWTDQQPVSLPGNEHAGVLTHPAWLVAWSANSENDPIRRGKWIRTRLLGGSVPDVPIGVEAIIPDDPHRTLRDRLQSATSRAECWRCHRQMDSLGLPFEQFNHYGHFRNHELDRPADTGGLIDRTGDARLDGTAIFNPVEMMDVLSESERVEQVFVRHVFRFFLGRNETLGDARTLQDGWQAYRKSGGSFRALVVALLTSDSFLTRMPPS